MDPLPPPLAFFCLLFAGWVNQRVWLVINAGAPYSGSKEATMPAQDPKPYLEYLDKEMTIMGLLSTFDVAVTGLILNASLGQQRGELQTVWQSGHWYLVTASFWMLLAALIFYRQRSLLAYYYGQIALSAVDQSCADYRNIESALKEANSWTTWFLYRVAFACTIVGFFNYGLALVSTVASPVRNATAILVVVGASAISILVYMVHTKARLAEIDRRGLTKKTHNKGTLPVSGHEKE
jgi:hypothetical protein